MIQRHLSQEPERRPQFGVDRGRGIIVQYLLNQVGVLKGVRRNCGVGVGSKLALVETRNECGKQLALAD